MNKPTNNTKQIEEGGSETSKLREIIAQYSGTELGRLILFLTEYGQEHLMCPRCGWHEGKIWHCGLCEGSTKNIFEWYGRLLKNGY